MFRVENQAKLCSDHAHPVSVRGIPEDRLKRQRKDGANELLISGGELMSTEAARTLTTHAFASCSRFIPLTLISSYMFLSKLRAGAE